MSEQPNGVDRKRPDRKRPDFRQADFNDVEAHSQSSDRKRPDLVSGPDRKRPDLLEDEDVEGHMVYTVSDVQPQRDEDLGGAER